MTATYINLTTGQPVEASDAAQKLMATKEQRIAAARAAQAAF